MTWVQFDALPAYLVWLCIALVEAVGIGTWLWGKWRGA